MRCTRHSSPEKAGRSMTVGKSVTHERARQGHWGRRAFLVLVVGLVLAAAVWVGVEIYGEMIEPPGVDLPGNLPG